MEVIMDDSWILGYDCYNMEIEEGTILRAMWSNDIDIIELEDEDPREYCAIRDKNGKAWAISINDYQNRGTRKVPLF